MAQYEFTARRFPVNERGIAAALDIDYDELLANRKRADEERAGVHGADARDVRALLDELQRETLRQMVGF